MTDDSIATRVRSVAEAFAVTGLTRITLKDIGFELELRRSAAYVPPKHAVSAEPLPADQPAMPKPDVVTSDLVGVLRLSRPQVNEGHQLDSDRELAFVEALGIRNPVRSRGAGRIAAVFVTDGQPVEYGQPLFAIERSP
jgi:acetyl-CoA carboxylase biotin carboxyl carrier protein